MTFLAMQAIGAVLDSEHLAPSERLVAIAYARRANRDGEAWPGITRLTLDTALSRTGARRIRDRLVLYRILVDQDKTRNRCPVYRFSVAGVRDYDPSEFVTEPEVEPTDVGQRSGPTGVTEPEVEPTDVGQRSGPTGVNVVDPQGSTPLTERMNVGQRSGPSRVNVVDPKGQRSGPDPLRPLSNPSEQNTRVEHVSGVPVNGAAEDRPTPPQLDLVTPPAAPDTRTRLELVIDHWLAQWQKRQAVLGTRPEGMPRKAPTSNPQLEACLRRKDPATGKPYTPDRLNRITSWAFWSKEAEYLRGEATWTSSRTVRLGLSALFRHRDGKVEERLELADAWFDAGQPTGLPGGRFVALNPQPDEADEASTDAFDAF